MNLQKYSSPHPSLAFKLKQEFSRPLNFKLRRDAARAELISRLLRPAFSSLFGKRSAAEEQESLSSFVAFAANEG